jgi:hypothetical protein
LKIVFGLILQICRADGVSRAATHLSHLLSWLGSVHLYPGILALLDAKWIGGEAQKVKCDRHRKFVQERFAKTPELA